MNVSIRNARPADHPFLLQMLLEAAYWRPGQARPPLNEALANPALTKWLDAWGREGDIGVIAETPDAQLAGAAWFRFWTDDHHSYGYVDASTPELAIGVAPEFRGRGIGAALLHALIGRARAKSRAAQPERRA